MAADPDRNRRDFALAAIAVCLAVGYVGAAAEGLASATGAWFWRLAIVVPCAMAAGLLLARRALPRTTPGPPGSTGGGADPRTAESVRSALDHLDEAVVVVDRSAQVTLLNRAAAELLAANVPASIGRPVAAVLSFARPLALLQDTLANGMAQREEVALPARGPDAPIALEVTIAPLRDGGAVLVMDDLSRLRRLEAHRREFVANVSHELKTPLAAIQGYCETMLDDRAMAEETRQRFLGKIARQSERLAHLVRDLLALSRLDDEPVTPPVAPCDWAPVVRECVRDLGPLAERKQQALTVEVAPDAIPIRADREPLLQVTVNLLENAIKYTQDGGQVSVSLARDGDQALLEVRDTGIGLSPDDQDRVFERFYRVDRARSREVGGTGLGLAIVKNTVLSLGGRVGVRSALDQGSTFWVRLPLVRPRAQPGATA